MKLEELEQIVKKAVRQVMQEELREILTEAVEIASRPEPNKRDYSEASREKITGGFNFSDILQETAQEMTKADFKNIFENNTGGEEKYKVNSVSTESDMSDLPSFARNAKAVLDASKDKDKTRHAL